MSEEYIAWYTGILSPKLDVDIVVHSCSLHVRSHSS